jgi:hypothetical protein
MRVRKKIAAGSVLIFILSVSAWAAAQDDMLGGSAEGEFSAVADTETAAPAPATSSGRLKLERPLLLTRHTMELGGQITLAPQASILEGDNLPDNSMGGGEFTFSPHVGYFVIDKLEILFDFGLAVPFGDARGADDVTVSFAVGARYFIDFEVVALYMGGMMGPSWEIPDASSVPARDYFDINIMVGVLVPINRHIGIDLGMRMNNHIGLGDDFSNGQTRTTISFPMGYFGVNGFFNFITGG